MTSLDKLAQMDGWEVDQAEEEIQLQVEASCSDGPEPQARSGGGNSSQVSVGSQDTRPSFSDGAVSDSLRNTFPAASRADLTPGVSGVGRSERSSHPAAQHAWRTSPSFSNSSEGSTLVGKFLKRGFGRDVGSGRGRSLAGGGVFVPDEGDVVAKLKASLERAQEEVALERERREMLEEQARVAYASLKDESKKRQKARGERRKEAAAAGGLVGDSSSSFNSWERKTRSLSPVRRDAPQRGGDPMEVAENHARMVIIADATEAAREEAQSALDTVEGFAALNKKLVDELRAAVIARDDLIKDLAAERGFREQLERDVEELLESGLVAEIKEKQAESEARYEKEQKETARVVAVHARMEEEYGVALKSSERERARLEETIVSLEDKLEAERHTEVVRAKENRERATMGSEEVRSLRAGLLSRIKLRGNNRRQHHVLAGNATGIRTGQGGSKGNSLWLSAAQERINPQKHAPRSVAAVRHVHGKSGRPGERASRRQPSSNLRRKNENNAHVDPTVSSAPVGVSVAGEHYHSPVRKGIDSGGDGRGGSSVGNGGGGRGDGSLGHAVHASAVENIEWFLGDFVPKVRAQPPAVAALLSAAAAPEEKGAGEGQGGGAGGSASAKKVSKWAAIGRAGKISARATAVCAEEAIKAAEAEALQRLRSLINSTARAFSASWFSLLTTVPTTVAAARGTIHSGIGGDDSGDHTITEESGNINAIGSEGGRAKSTDAIATVPAVVVRRLFQSCGILRSNAGGPTLAHADMELQRNAVGKGGRSVGYPEYFKVVVALSQYRFAGESKDEALEKLSRTLQKAQSDSRGTTPHARTRQGQGNVGGTAHRVQPLMAKPAPASAENGTRIRENEIIVASPGVAGQEDGLAGAERILDRDRRALEAIFLHYSTGALVDSAALASFCKDFELSPGLVSREDAHRIYVQLAYPNETLLTPKLVAAREALQGRRAAGRRAGWNEEEAEGKIGLGVAQWIAWLGLAAIGCTWFDKQRGLYNTPEKKVLGLLQWMEGSVGKKRISSKRGAPIVPAFNLLPLRATRR